jgi:hypothetical protein
VPAWQAQVQNPSSDKKRKRKIKVVRVIQQGTDFIGQIFLKENL